MQIERLNNAAIMRSKNENYAIECSRCEFERKYVLERRNPWKLTNFTRFLTIRSNYALIMRVMYCAAFNAKL